MNFLDNIKNMSPKCKSILQIIQKNGPFTKKELLEITGLTLTTLNRLMSPLLKESYIEELGQDESSGGRKPSFYGVSSRYYLIGIDISRTYTKILLINFKMDIIRNYQFLMDNKTTPEVVLELIFNKILEWKKEFKNIIFLGAGIGAVGPIDRNNGIILNPKNFISSGWYNINILKLFKERINIPVTIDNGTNMAVLAEKNYGSGSQFDNIAYINCGIGIRSGIILTNTIIRTKNNIEDSFAHMVIDINGRKCSCGGKGCLESISSIHSIIEEYKEMIKRGHKTLLLKTIDSINYIDICRAAELGEETANKILIKAGKALGIAISNYIKILNLELIILSGPLVKHSNIFYNEAISSALGNCYQAEKNNITFIKGGRFDDNSIAMGAAASIFQFILK